MEVLRGKFYVKGNTYNIGALENQTGSCEDRDFIQYVT